MKYTLSCVGIFLLSFYSVAHAQTGFVDSEYSFGKVFSGEIVEVTAVFQNRELYRIDANNVNISCSCFSTLFESTVCLPNQSINIPIIIDTNNRVGVSKQIIELETSEGNFSTIVSGYSSDDLRNTPSFGEIKGIGKNKGSLIFLDSKDFDFNIVSITKTENVLFVEELSESDLLQYLPKDTSRKRIKGVKFWFQSHPKKKENYTTEICITTNHPSRSQIRYPIHVLVDQFEKIRVFPRHCIIKYEKETEISIRKDLKVTKSGMTDFKIFNATPTITGINVLNSNDQNKGSSTVTIIYSPEKFSTDRSTQNGKIFFDSSWGEFIIPITVIAQ